MHDHYSFVKHVGYMIFLMQLEVVIARNVQTRRCARCVMTEWWGHQRSLLLT